MRALTAQELGYTRSSPQYCQFGLAIWQPTTVYTAVSSTMSTNDSVSFCGYSQGVGTLSDVLPGMTIYFGSSAGAHDVAMLRVRKTPGANILYFNEVSDIDWTISHYVTIVREFSIWPKHWRLIDSDPTHISMDYDVSYSAQHSTFDPIVNMGQDWVVWLSGGTTTVAPNATGSSVWDSTVASYLWSVIPSTGVTIDDSTAATPNIVLTIAGQYVLSCTVTGANGATHTGYRSIFVFDKDHQPFTNFSISSCRGAMDTGGWSFNVSLNDYTDSTLLRDRAKVLLFAYNETYGSTQFSIGPYLGAENIICMGWIEGASIERDAVNGDAWRFTVRGPQYWLSKIYGFPSGVKYSSTNPTSWLYLKGLTVDRGLWTLLHWRSTFTQVCDMYFSGNTKLLPAAEGIAGSLWQQITINAMAILARPACDRFGVFYSKVDPQYTAVSARTSFPEVMNVQPKDWIPPAVIDYQPLSNGAILDASGVAYDGTTATPYLSRAPGHAPKVHGGGIQIDKLLVSSQDDLNAMAGLYLGQLNNTYPSTVVQLASNNRMFDITPPSYIRISLPEDPVTGGLYVGRQYVPRNVSFSIDVSKGSLYTEVDGEGATQPENAVLIPVPITPGEPNFPDIPVPGPYVIVPSGGTTFPDVVVPNDGGDGYVDPNEKCTECLSGNYLVIGYDPVFGDWVATKGWGDPIGYPSDYGFPDADPLDPWRSIHVVGYADVTKGTFPLFLAGYGKGALCYQAGAVNDTDKTCDIYLRHTANELSKSYITMDVGFYWWDTGYHAIKGKNYAWWNRLPATDVIASSPIIDMYIWNTAGYSDHLTGTVEHLTGSDINAGHITFTLPTFTESLKIEYIYITFDLGGSTTQNAGWDHSGDPKSVQHDVVMGPLSLAGLPQFNNCCAVPRKT